MDKKHIVYKITNTINNKIYIGRHSTYDIHDSYMGSSQHLRKAIMKYGSKYFIKEILYIFNTLEECAKKERELVDEIFIARTDTYNVALGGLGTSNFANPLIQEKARKKGLKKLKELYNDESFRENRRKNLIDMGDKGRAAFYSKYNCSLFAYLNSNPEFQKKKKEIYKSIDHQKGIKNSQYGTIWITDGANNMKLKNTEKIPTGWRRGRTIKR